MSDTSHGPDLSANPNTGCFTHCPACGRSTLAPKSVKSFCCGSCGFLFFINCAAAAMALIMDDKNRLLVTIRRHEPAKGAFDLPGGFAEPGEGIEDSLRREVMEELNLALTKLTYLCSFANHYPYESVVYPVTDMAFVCETEGFDTIKAGDDVAGYTFIPLDELDPSQFCMSSAVQVVRYLKAWFADRADRVRPNG